jgi:hypothetical protein
MSNNQNLKIIRILEIVWLTIAIASMAIAIFELHKTDLQSGHLFFLFTIAGGIMYYIRRNQRKKLEQ